MSAQPIDFRQQKVLITGASSGLGEEFARHLAWRGADLILVARREDRLREIAQRLQEASGVNVDYVPFDLGRTDAGTALRSKLGSRGLHPTSIVNNAGFANSGYFHDIDQERLRQEITLDVAAMTDIARTYIDDLRVRPGNFLINVASVAGYQPNPRIAVYSAAKAYVLSFSESLWYESRGTGLRVLCLGPGPTTTEFFDIAGQAAGGGLPFMDATTVVGTAMKALTKKNPPPSIVPGVVNQIITGSSRLVPRRVAATLSGITTDRAFAQLGSQPK